MMKTNNSIVGVVFIGIIFSSLFYSFYNFSRSFSAFSHLLPSDADAIVVLTGGKGRLSQALKLFNETQAKVLLISGAGSRATLTSIFSEEEMIGVDASKIILEQESKSTHENAIQAKKFIIEHDMRTIILVTSNYHMKRAYFIFRDIFPDNIEIIPHAVESDNFPLDGWWRDPKAFKIAFFEFFKYMWYRLFFLVQSHEG